MEIEKIIDGLHPLEHKFLNAFKDKGADALSDEDVMAKAGLDEARLDMVVGWLSTKGVLTVSETGKEEIVSLTDIGKRYAAAKIPELRIVNELKEGKKFTIKDLQQRGDMEPTEISSAIGGLKEAGIISIVEGRVFFLCKRQIQQPLTISRLQLKA